jgi:hypothetical protein
MKVGNGYLHHVGAQVASTYERYDVLLRKRA